MRSYLIDRIDAYEEPFNWHRTPHHITLYHNTTSDDMMHIITLHYTSPLCIILSKIAHFNLIFPFLWHFATTHWSTLRVCRSCYLSHVMTGWLLFAVTDSHSQRIWGNMTDHEKDAGEDVEVHPCNIRGVPFHRCHVTELRLWDHVASLSWNAFVIHRYAWVGRGSGSGFLTKFLQICTDFFVFAHRWFPSSRFFVMSSEWNLLNQRRSTSTNVLVLHR